MKKNSTYLLFAFLYITSGCANYYLNKANQEFDNLAYAKAIETYKRCLSIKEIPEARTKLAHSYRLENDVIKAEQEYARVQNIPDNAPINTFYYAKLQMELGKYEEAKRSFNSYLKKVPNDPVAQMLLASCNSIDSFNADTALYKIKLIDLESVSSEFACIPYKNGIIFTAEKEVKSDSKKNPWTGKSYLDLYYSQKGNDGKWSSPQLLNGEITGKYHDGPATCSKTGNIVYYTRSNHYKAEEINNNKHENNFKILRAELINDKWSNLQELPFTSDEYSVGHPCLSTDEKTLYFSSDMPGGFGGTDIYYATFDGIKWSAPTNIGNTINTPGNEMFPYEYKDGSFYFSSDAHNSVGGLDIFTTSYKDKKWSKPQNMKYPLNTNKDDFAYIMLDDSSGYISSNRSGADRIYQFSKESPKPLPKEPLKFFIEGIVLDNKTKKPLANASVEILGRKMIQLVTDNQGKYKTEIAADDDYLVLASIKDYFNKSENVKIHGEKESKTIRLDFSLNEMIVEKPIVLDNIYYDLAKWDIRPEAARELDKLIKTLKDNPSIHIELSSHTDSQASDKYNLTLSEKRAKSVVDYLISGGINANLLTWKGYGESKPLNRCINDVPCSEEEHQKNRRTEFKVIKVAQATSGL